MSVAINEAVFLLHSLSPARLDELRRSNPSLSQDLALGIIAGPEDNHSSEQVLAAILHDKAEIMVVALSEAGRAAQQALLSVARRVRSARRQRLLSQTFVLIGSSSSLATLARDNRGAAIIAAVITLLAALGNLFAENREKLLNPQAGNVYDVFQRLSEGEYKTRTLSTELTLAMKYHQGTTELQLLVASANALCEQLNGWLIQMVSSRPR